MRSKRLILIYKDNREIVRDSKGAQGSINRDNLFVKGQIYNTNLVRVHKMNIRHYIVAKMLLFWQKRQYIGAW